MAGSEWEGTFFFDPEDGIYGDHFPGNPIVPGSLIVQAFVRAAQGMNLLKDLREIDNFRFKRFVSPGEYRYRIVRRKEALECTLYEDSTALAKGSLK